MLRCNEDPAPACTLPAALGPDGEDRAYFNDVDDYHNLHVVNEAILSALGSASNPGTNSLYQGFSARVSVVYDEDMDGQADNNTGNSKLITVIVTTPNDEDLVFATYRSNF
jgi:MSHA pilin protein MshD